MKGKSAQWKIIDVIDVEKIELHNKGDDNFKQDVFTPHMFTRSVTIHRAVSNLKQRCPDNVYLCHPNTLYKASLHNVTWQHMTHDFLAQNETLPASYTILFPTFFRHYKGDHWFLTIYKKKLHAATWLQHIGWLSKPYSKMKSSAAQGQSWW